MSGALFLSTKPRGSRGPVWWIAVPLCATVLLGVAACTGGDAPAPVADVPTFEGSVDLEIGEVEGDDAYLFSRIAAVAADPVGA